MSLVCNKLRSLALPVCAMICAGMLAACTSTPPEDDEAIPAKSVARNASSAATSAASSTSSATATSAATLSAAKPQGSAPAEAGVNTAATPAPVMVPPEALVKFNKAMLPVYAGKLDEGARQLEQLAAAYPALSVPYINEGLMYLKANQFEDAERVLKLALQRDPNSAIANNYLGVAERNLGKFKDAEAAYKAAIAADDNYAVAHLNLAVLYDLYLQQPEDAVQQYDRYQQLVPNPDPKIVNWIREIHNRVGAAKKPTATETSSTTQPGATP